MAGGGSHRGVSNANNNRGKPYGLMLVLAFGAALFGVMLIHKLKERRIFNLLVKEKDQQLNSLHFLLQKEREYTKQLKSKNEEMKAKIYSIRTQKMELERRILEMQSTIESFKDEHKTMESALVERQNEIKMLRDANFDAENGTNQMITLTESLKKKDAEIEDLKQRLMKPLKIWSVSADDPSNPTTDTNNDKLNESQSKEVVDHLQISNSYNDSANSTSVNATETMSTVLKNRDTNTEATNVQENRNETIYGNEVSREVESQKADKSIELESSGGKETIENVEEGRNENSQSNHSLGTGEETNSSNVIFNSVRELSKAQDALGTVKSGVNEEKPKNTKGTESKEKTKHRHASKVTAKSWRTLPRNRLLENGRNLRRNSFLTLKNRKFAAETHQARDRKEASAFNNLLQPKNGVDSSTTKSLEPQNSDFINIQGNMKQVRVVEEAPEKITYQNSQVLWSKNPDKEPKNTREVQQRDEREASDINNGSSDIHIRQEEMEDVDGENPREERTPDSYKEAELEEDENVRVLKPRQLGSPTLDKWESNVWLIRA